MQTIKIDIGSGRSTNGDYLTLDKDISVGARILCDFEGDTAKEDLKEYIGKCDEARISHCLEHFKPENKVKVMALCWELLKDGGILDVEIPLFPHPASVQDPTHISFWTAESFWYFIKGNAFGEAFAKRYSQYKVPLFQFVESWYKGDEKNPWAYGVRLKKVF